MIKPRVILMEKSTLDGTARMMHYVTYDRKNCGHFFVSIAQNILR